MLGKSPALNLAPGPSSWECQDCQGFLCFLIVFDEYNLKINWNFNLDAQEKGLCVQCVKKWLTTWFLHALNYTYMDIWHNIIIIHILIYIYIYTLCVCIRAVTQSKSGSLHVVHAMQAVQVARSMSESNSARWGHLSVSWRRHSDQMDPTWWFHMKWLMEEQSIL